MDMLTVRPRSVATIAIRVVLLHGFLSTMQAEMLPGELHSLQTVARLPGLL